MAFLIPRVGIAVEDVIRYYVWTRLDLNPICTITFDRAYTLQHQQDIILMPSST